MSKLHGIPYALAVKPCKAHTDGSHHPVLTCWSYAASLSNRLTGVPVHRQPAACSIAAAVYLLVLLSGLLSPFVMLAVFCKAHPVRRTSPLSSEYMACPGGGSSDPSSAACCMQGKGLLGLQGSPCVPCAMHGETRAGDLTTQGDLTGPRWSR